MRLRLMATYLGVPYQAGLGPDGTEVMLLSAGPPPEELGFTAAAGHWRKQVSMTDLDAPVAIAAGGRVPGRAVPGAR